MSQLVMGKIIYPDAPPSVSDGKVVWQKLNCAVCHGVERKRVSGKSAQLTLTE